MLAQDERGGPRRFAYAAALGSLLALAVDVWMLKGTAATLVRDNGLLGSFYDVQGRALLDGHLYVDPGAVSFEGFRIDGRTYTYFGLFPTLLRLPVLLVTHDLDGRLTQLSMLLALVVLLGGGALLHWRLRALVRPGAALSRADMAAAGLAQLALGAGAVPLYLTSRTVVYHEAELWGAALSIAALAVLVRVIVRPTPGAIAVAGLLTTFAVNARFSVGLGPVLALFALALALAARRWSFPASFAPRARMGDSGRVAVMLAAAALIALGTHAAVNTAKLGQPFGIPIDKQVYSHTNPDRRAALEANGGTIFGVKFVPTTLVQAVRPDAVGGLRAFPYVGLPREPAPVIGDAVFDTIEPSLSAVTSMPALFLLTLMGLAALLRRRELWPMLAILVATAAAYTLTLTIAFVTTRYLADLLPLLALGGLVGLQAALGSTPRRGLLLGGVAALVLAGVVVNGAVGIAGQRLYDEATEAQRASFVGSQDDVDRWLGRSPHGIRAGAALPATPPGSPGDLFVLGRCAGLYVHGLNGEWLPAERTEGAGVHRLQVRFPASIGPRPQALLTLRSGARRLVVSAAGSAEALTLGVDVAGRPAETGPPIALPPTRAVELEVSVDSFSGGTFARVEVDGRHVLTAASPDLRTASAIIGRDPGGILPFSGSVERDRIGAPVCRTVASRAGLLTTRAAG